MNDNRYGEHQDMAPHNGPDSRNMTDAEYNRWAHEDNVRHYAKVGRDMNALSGKAFADANEGDGCFGLIPFVLALAAAVAAVVRYG